MLRWRSKTCIAAFSLSLIFGLVASITPTAMAQGNSNLRPTPANISDLQLNKPVEATQENKINASLAGAQGRQQVVVRLATAPAALSQPGVAQATQRNAVSDQQTDVMSRVRTLDSNATMLGRVNLALNAVMLEIDANALPALAADPRVVSINPVVNYEHATDTEPMETVPYIGATPDVQAKGSNGKDVKVAVFDSGIDFTHTAFDGPGTLEGYARAYCGNPAAPPPFSPACGDAYTKPADPALFGPTAPRVKGGFDFVGEQWPRPGVPGGGPLNPDPNPIDFEGHGTSVADIIGGKRGVAPEVDLYAVKVCSAIAGSCSGVALLQGMDFALDPNGDGQTDDRVGIINMSLGASYGQNYDDDLSAAVDNATSIGVLTVASAGNSADRPYIVGTPSAARSALSVAQTAVPSDIAPLIEISPGPLNIYSIFQRWSARPTTLIRAPIQYGVGSNVLGCTPFPAGSMAGKIGLVDRGGCATSIKFSNIAAAGGVAAIMADNVAGAVPPTLGFGGGTPNIPGVTILQTDGIRIKGLLTSGGTVTASIDPAKAQNVAGSTVSSSSRGPAMGQMFYGNQAMFGQIIKPEIGAPGGSVAAEAGTGSSNQVFGGTSGAAPMVSGAAALLQNATNAGLSPWELKSRLMNTGKTDILNRPEVFGGGLAPITRIGGGEVRVNQAIAAQAAAWEQVSRGGALSFGLVDASNATTTLRRTVVVRNYGDTPITYQIQPTFRFENDAANGAISVSTPATLRVPPRSSRAFRVALSVDGTKLRPWGLNSGSLGGNGDTLTVFEYDGYLRLVDTSNSANNLQLPWQVLPRLSGDVRGPNSVRLGGSATFSNRGVGRANIDAFALIGSGPLVNTSPGAGQQQPPLNLRYVGVAAFDGAGVCPNNTPVIQFAVNTYERTTHANYPAQFQIELDTNRDGTADYVVFNQELSGFAVSGQNATFVRLANSTAGQGDFFTNHGTNSANTVLTFCGSRIGLTGPNDNRLINTTARLFDNYFTGQETSKIEGMAFAPGDSRYAITVDDIAPGGTGSLSVADTGSKAATTESGVLLLLDASRGSATIGGVPVDVRGGSPEGNDARAVTVNP